MSSPSSPGERLTDRQRRTAALVLLPPAVALLAAVLAAFVLREGTASADVFERTAFAVVALGAVVLACCARPAWPLSIGLGLAVFSGNWASMGIPVPLDRLLIATGIVSAVVRARRDRVATLRLEPVHWLLLLVAAYAVGSALLAGTLDERQARFALLDRLTLIGFALFFVAPLAFREARDRHVLLGTLVVLGAYLGITAVLETTGPEALVLPSYITDPSVGIHSDRARGPFVEAAANGLALYACAVAAMLAAWTWRDPRARRYAAFVAALCALGILLTVTRAAWIASIAATLVTLLVLREGRRFVLPAIVVGVAGVLLAFAVIPGLQARATGRIDDERPIWDRQNSNAAALRMIDARPAFGFGWGRFPDESPAYYRQSRDYPLTFVRNLHNVYLVNAVELGVVGALLWLLGVATALVSSLRRRGPPELRPWRIALGAMVVSYAVSALSTPLGFVLPTLLLWTWAGMLRADGGGTEPLRPRR